MSSDSAVIESFPPAILAASQQAMADWGFLLDAGRPIEFVAHIIADHQPPAQTRKVGGLTRRQKDVVDFVSEYAAANGISPSYDEIRVHLGLASKSGVHRLVQELVGRGVIDFMADRARTIIVRPEYRPAWISADQPHPSL